jgi:hypothetical protein
VSELISPLILLAEEDNVLVCRFPVKQGDLLLIDGAEVPAETSVDTGHKLARRALSAGDIVVKYGAPIGSMTKDVAAGGHVHLHNMKSNYIASHTRQAVSGEGTNDRRLPQVRWAQRHPQRDRGGLSGRMRPSRGASHRR